MKKFLTVLALVCTLCMTVCSCASACTTIYVGSAASTDGSVIFGRSEDFSNSQNKLMFVEPEGNHKAGEEYAGCYGFTYTFTHDSYGYTAFRDDNVLGVCPDCGGEHAHTPYEAAGTNSKGVSVTATETLYCSEEAEAADPFEDLGIEEAEIVTVLLSESATAKEALDLLCSIYDNAGANGASGIIIADASEVWYIENLTGHNYLAVKCDAESVFVEPNMSIIGAIDLDDTENVKASANLMSIAQSAGILVGDADANIINYTETYNAGQEANARMINALNWMNASYAYSEDALPEASVYQITNLDAEGAIAPMHTGFVADRALAIADVIDFYHISNIGYERNLETHIFEISGAEATDTVEWVAMDDASCNVFVPYYPMLTTDVLDSLKVGTATAEFVTEQPADGDFFPATTRVWTENGAQMVEGFMVLPEGWETSYYWCADALTNTVKFGGVSEEAAADVKAQLAEMQNDFIVSFVVLGESIAADPDNASALATAASMEMAAAAQAKLLELYNGLK